jgi:ATP-binding cassette subfamily B protein
MVRAKNEEKAKTTGRTLHYYWQEVKKYKWYSLGMIISTPIVVFIRAILAPLIFADLIEKASLGLPAEELLGMAAVEIIGFFVLYVLNKVVLEELRLYWCWKMEVLAMYDLAVSCFTVVNDQSMQFHNDRFSGSLVSQTNKFVWAFERLVDTVIWDLWPTLVYILMVIVVLAPQVPWFAAGIVGFVALYALVSGLSFKKIAHLSDNAASAETKQTGQLADSISNIISVKSYAHEAHERHRYADFSRATLDANYKQMHATIKRDLQFNGVQIGITALILTFLVFGREWLGISIATLVLIVNYAQTIQGELWNINSIFKNINRVFGDAHEMTIILDMVDDVVDAPDAKVLDLQEAAVKFDQIDFKHKDAKDAIFQNFTLEVKPGERIGLVGVSGSGKTTLTKLLLRFADVSAGQITISGQDIRKITQQSLRENIAYVPQETSLFHRSIAENIAYGKLDATQDEIEHAAKLANAHEFIKDLPEGYNTLVGERGIKLSGGQRQRIAIARAILKDAPILVLDEATSALDSESEALIQDALNTLMQGRTSIVIAHRLSTVASLDRIVVLEDGKIVEQGTHHQLLGRSHGVYNHLWSRQSGAFMEEG